MKIELGIKKYGLEANRISVIVDVEDTDTLSDVTTEIDAVIYNPQINQSNFVYLDYTKNNRISLLYKLRETNQKIFCDLIEFYNKRCMFGGFYSSPHRYIIEYNYDVKCSPKLTESLKNASAPIFLSLKCPATLQVKLDTFNTFDPAYATFEVIINGAEDKTTINDIVNFDLLNFDFLSKTDRVLMIDSYLIDKTDPLLQMLYMKGYIVNDVADSKVNSRLNDMQKQIDDIKYIIKDMTGLLGDLFHDVEIIKQKLP